MADIIGGHEIGHPNLNLTAEEKRLFGQLFRTADTENIGVVTGEIAVKFFEKTKLSPTTLGEIWQIADTENRGLLTPAGFAVVLRLIGYAQAGRQVSAELASKPGPLPKFEGYSSSASAPPASPPPLQPQYSGGGPIRVPPLSPDKAKQYANLFETSGPENGVLSGEKAKQIFEKARLPNEILGRIWFLADREQKGALTITEFIIAMHLLTSYVSGVMRGLPQSLPTGLYDAALKHSTSLRAASISGPATRPVSEMPPASAIPRQFSGAGPMRTQSPMSFASYSTPPQPLSAQSTSNDWLITPQDKAQFDRSFAALDTTNRQYITGEEAVGFFTKARLPEEILAQIWDLADMRSEGRLNRDEFAVAMYLIRQQRTKRGPLPTVLPVNLVPPSMRQAMAQSQTAALSFDAPAASQMSKSATDDLFGLDAFTSPEPQKAQATGASATSNGPFSTPTSPRSLQGTHISPQNTSSVFKPFVPSSAFGQTLSAQITGGSNATAMHKNVVPPTLSAPIEDDLLGDNDPETSNMLTQETAELANISNQVSTLSKQTQDVQNQRSNADQNLTQATTQKKQFEMRLMQLRTAYEQEVKDLRAVEQQLGTTRDEVRRLQQDIAMIEGTQQDTRNRYQQASAALESERNEKANLQEKLRQMNAEIARLKPEIEKTNSQLRQQKGLNAISKKQLSTLEGERDKLSEQLDNAKRGADDRVGSISSAQSPEGMRSPGGSSITRQTTNPFFKSVPGSGDSRPTSPTSTTQQAGPNHDAFDSIFGPFSATSTATPPPVSFGGSPPNQPQDVTLSDPLSGSAPSSNNNDVFTPSATPPPASQISQPPPPNLPVIRQDTAEFQPASSSVQPSQPGSGFDSENSLEFVSFIDGSADAPPAKQGEKVGEEASNQHVPGSFPGNTRNPTPQSGNGVAKEEVSKSESPFHADDGADDDFEAAFAGLGSSKLEESGDSSFPSAMTKSSDEFPPIQELTVDDDSSSSSEVGFDDNFTSGAQGDHDGPKETAVVASNPTSFPPESGNLQSTHESPNAGSPNNVSSTAVNEQKKSMVKSKDDFDDAFGELDEAKEDKEDDMELAPNATDDVDDFNPTFDSPSASNSNTLGSTTEAVHPDPAFLDFERGFGDANQSPLGGTSQQPATTTDPDWDSLFAGLDGATKTEQLTNDDDFFNPKVAADKPNGGEEKGNNVNRSTSNLNTPPVLSRADTTEHDDPILKQLTGMGYARDVAVAALEKFDYNLEKAADYLTSQS